MLCFRIHGFFDVKVFNVNTDSVHCAQVSECEKQWKYDQCSMEIDLESFTPLVFSTFGGMGPVASVFTIFISPKDFFLLSMLITHGKCRANWQYTRGSQNSLITLSSSCSNLEKGPEL